MHEPKISVCIPTYNRAPYLHNALRSVLRQTLEDFEIVVYDDASTDETMQVAYAFGDPRIRYFRQPVNAGVAATRNACLAVARGQFIAWLDSDDEYLPEMLAVQSGVLDAHPQVAMVHGAFHVMDANGRALPDWPRLHDHDVIEAGAVAFRELSLWNEISAPTTLVRKRCHDRAGPYAPHIGASSTDWDMWLRIARTGAIAYTARPLARYRYHDASISGATTATGQRLRCDIAVIVRTFERERRRDRNVEAVAWLARSALGVRALLQAGDAATAGHSRSALDALALGWRASPALRQRRETLILALALVLHDEYRAFTATRALLAALYGELEGTRFARSIRKRAVPDAAWDAELTEIAQTVRRVVPRSARLASVDKCDPTLFRLSHRRGWHFPDRRLLPDGYPADDDVAIQHLEEIRRRGAEFIVFPRASFWWLDHYSGLRGSLEQRHQRVWRDERCVIYRLQPEAAWPS